MVWWYMQESFTHTPLAQLLQQRAEKLAQDPVQQSAQQSAQPLRKKASPASFAQATEPVIQEEDKLFMQAMGSLIEQPSFIHNNSRRPRQNTFHAQQKVYSLAEATSFGQLMMKDTKKKQKASRKKAKSSLTAQNAHIQAQASLPEEQSMQELLQAEKALATGQDAEGMQAFFTAMKEVSPLTGKGRDVAPEVEPSHMPLQMQDPFAVMMEKKLEFSLALKGEYIEGHVVGLDDLTMNNLRAGVYSPEAHLDMHGLNAMQAYEAMVGFFKSSWYKGMRTLLLIPGRGKNSPNGVSVLREKVQLWLTQDPFKRVVLAFCTAQPVDGGPGTIYVLVRKYKKKGKICWERLPSDPDLY